MMATATATPSRIPSTAIRTSIRRPAMAATSSSSSSAKANVLSSASISAFETAQAAVELEPDEEWVRQLEEEQRQRFDAEARSMYKEFLAELAEVGPYGHAEARAEAQRRYEEALEQMRQMQQEELEQHIEMERQERLWSLGLQDERWDGWHRLFQEQASILENIKRGAARSSGLDEEVRSMEEKIKENQREVEELQRKSEDWQRTDHKRMQDRQRWAEKQRQINRDIENLRQRDREAATIRMAQEKAREAQSSRLEAEARYSAAQLRSRMSSAALNQEFEASRRSSIPPLSETSSGTSVPDNIFSTSPSVGTPASSIFGDESQQRNFTESSQPRSSTARSTPITIPIPEDRRQASTLLGSGSSPLSRARPSGMPSTPSPSPLSSTPTSNTMAWAKGEDAPRPKVWIPPEGARAEGVPARKSSMLFEGAKEPARKASQLFGASPGPSPSPTLEEHSRKVTNEQASRPQGAPSPQPRTQPPSAPPTRTQPLPQFGPGTTSQPRASTVTQPPYTPQSASSTAHAPPLGDTKPKQEPTHGSTPLRPAPAPTSYAGAKNGPTPPMSGGSRPAPPTTRADASSGPKSNTPPKPAPSASSTTDQYRSKLREDYLRGEAQRAEEEKRRREEEANERRAEEARRRGMENRRKEEQAREAERREAERKARLTGKASLSSIGPERPILEVWNAYESHWAAMATASQLRFRSIPWPIGIPVTSPEMLLPIKIAAFILSPLHSGDKPRKDRIKEALLRWHPDRFESKWLNKVVEEERELVREGVGLVVRALNDLLSTEGTFAG